MDSRHLVISLILIAVFCTGFGNAYLCYVCNSEQSEGCATLETQPALQNCVPEDGPCYAYITEEGYTVRSCSPPPGPVSTEPLVCYADQCNGIVYPENRRQCHQCVGADCADPSNINLSQPTPCRRYVDNDNCYDVHDPHGFIAYRGCVSDPPQSVGISFCQTHIYQCNICRLNGCNTAIATYPDLSFSCVECNSTQDTNCFSLNTGTDTKICSPVITEYGPDACYTQIEDGVVYRGCLFEREVIEDDCRNGRNCTLCTTDNCNVVKTLETCYDCHSDSNPNCISNPTQELRNECPLSFGLGCYLFDDGGDVLIRGCLSALTTDEVDECRREDQFCKTCLGDDCNEKPTFQNCISCTSSNNLNCYASNPIQTPPTKLCRNYLDTCFLHVSNNTVTRGCFNEDANQIITNECPSNPTGQNIRCERCTGPNCNSNAVQATDFCYDCDSETNPNCRNNLNESMRIQCPLAASNLGCYMHNDGGDIVKRGCVSSLIVNEANYCGENSQYCKTCSGDSCNAKLDFQRCVQCTSNSDGNCYQSPTLEETTLCQAYSDVCFTHFENNVITRGCLAQSQLTESCRNPDLCRTCQTPNCNDETLTDEYCLRCNSEIDSNCASNVNLNFEVRCDLSVTPKGCFRYEDGGSIVRRGCVSDLVPGEVSVCRQQGNTCKTCVGRTCNAKETFTTCRACNSTTWLSCLILPTTQPTTLCRDYLDECFTHIKDEQITRGCILENPDYTTECNNPELCERCSMGENCNSDIIESEFCIKCDSEENENCARNLLIWRQEQCKVAVTPLGCYRFQEQGGSTIKRGCISELVPGEQNFCRNQNQQCKTCIGNGCNEKIDFQSCYSCSSSIDPYCWSNFTDVPIVLCRNYLDDCFSHIEEDGVVSRGCIDESQQIINRPTCSERDGCKLCGTDTCNSQEILIESCTVCNSEEDGNCWVNVDESMSRQCSDTINYLEDVDGCYLFKAGDGSLVRRGCVNNLPPEEEELCREQGSVCKTCIGLNCNQKEDYQSCYACDTYDGSDCIEPSLSMPTTVCRDLLDTCVVVAVENSETVRGCRNELSDEYDCNLQGRHCYHCTNNLCNSLIFPPDRAKCYQCSGLDCSANSLPDIERLRICLSYNSTEQCYTYSDDAGLIHRGCGSDISVHPTRCRLSGNCEWCDASQIGCNNQPTHRYPTISCAKCTGNEECAWRIETTGLRECNEAVIFPYNESCFTYVQPINGSVERGCSNERRDLCRTNECNQCTGNGCNTDSTRSQVCVVCNSFILGQEYCGDDEVTNATQECGAQSGVSYNDRGCYISNEGGIIRRGCFSRLATSNQTNCLSDEYKSCFYCEASGCNIGVPPSGAASLKSYTLLITLIFIFIKQILV